MIVSQIRIDTGDVGTFSLFVVKGVAFFTAELPWRNNYKNISCIPSGSYQCEITDSPKFGRVYKIKDVPDRTDILIHPGNWAGDIRKGYRSDSDGCVLLGKRIVSIYTQKAVASSKAALEEFQALLKNEPFTLVISDLLNVDSILEF